MFVQEVIYTFEAKTTKKPVRESTRLVWGVAQPGSKNAEMLTCRSFYSPTEENDFKKLCGGSVHGMKNTKYAFL